MRTANVNDNAAPKQDWWNAGLRWTGHDIMQLLLRLFWGDATPAGGSSAVLGGLECSAGSGASTDVTAGAALHYDASVYTSAIDGDETVAPLGLALTTSTENVTHSDNTSGNPRIDIVTVKSVIGTDRTKSVQQKGGGSSSQATRFGPVTTVQVTEGTPAGSPVAPATPTGQTKLAEVLVPDGTTSGNWAASVTYTDFRVIPGMEARGPAAASLALAAALYFKGNASPDVVELADIYDNAGVLQGRLAFQTGTGATLGGLPYWQRVIVPSGDSSGVHVPMMIPGGREFDRIVGFQGASYEIVTGAVSDIAIIGTQTGFKVTHLTGNAVVLKVFLSVPADVRGLEIVGIRCRYNVVVVPTGTFNLDFNADRVTGNTVTPFLAKTALDLTLGDKNQDLTGDMSDTPVIDASDMVGVWFELDLDAAADAAEIVFEAVEVTFKEGRT